MKTKDLIQLLTQLDPEGQHEVLINNLDIDYIHPSQPMYWDNKGYVIESRGPCNQPNKISLRSSGKKINVTSINPYTYFEQKIIEDQTFIEIDTENSVFFWETPKIYFNKLFSSNYCQEYLKESDIELYPYKHTLTTKIKNYITNLTKKFYTEYIHYCDKITDSTIEEIRIIKLLLQKIYSINPNIIFNLPQKHLNNSIQLNTNNIKGFFFTLKSGLLNYEVADIYDTSASNTTYLNIDIDTFDFKTLLSDPWNNLFLQKIENRFLKV